MNRGELREYLNRNVTHQIEKEERLSIINYYLDCYQELTSNVDSDIEKINHGYPVQYVCRQSFFYGYNYIVEEGVLIPRPETEELVHWIVSDMQKLKGLKVLDIGTGSGCILVSLMNKLNIEQAYAVDISEKALELATQNAEKYGHKLTAVNLNILNEDIPDSFGNLDIIVCNPPYILDSETSRMDESVIDYEPREALFVPYHDPLIFYKRILELFATKGEKKNTVLYFETSDLYIEDLETFLNTTKWDYEFRKDMQGKWRMLKCY